MTKDKRRKAAPFAIDSEKKDKRAQKREKTRLRRRKQRFRKLAIGLMIAVFMVCAVSTVMGYIRVAELKNEVEDKQQTVEQLESEYVSLWNKQQNAVTLSEVEQYAENVLGLVKYDKSKDERLELQKNDQVEVNQGSNGVEKLASSFVKSFSAILSFLR